LEIINASALREIPFCVHFELCGGCKWQHVQYATQLKFKQQQVVDNLERIGGLQVPAINDIIASENTRYYRNRLDFTFSNKKWLTKEEIGKDVSNEVPTLGFHVPGMFDKIFQVNHCYLQGSPSNEIRQTAFTIGAKLQIPFFDLRKQTGFLRTLTIRSSSTGEVMVILQVAYHKIEWVMAVLDYIDEQVAGITSLNYIVNEKRNDTFGDLDVVCYKGKSYITEEMSKPDSVEKLKFRIGAKSFYQTNSAQAYELYKAAWQMAGLTGNELVYDLYTGTGTIANFIAGNAKQVIGLEYVEAAIEDAKTNSTLNNIHNTAFFAGDIKDLLDDTFLAQHGKPDVIITDPPRAGMHADVCEMILKAAPQKIVYISCNPATQARDLALLAVNYEIIEIQPVDMFPHTSHVENIVLLKKRTS
jgi:23S rRNA (uracil1939-C5)-methyltransferase